MYSVYIYHLQSASPNLSVNFPSHIVFVVFRTGETVVASSIPHRTKAFDQWTYGVIFLNYSGRGN